VPWNPKEYLQFAEERTLPCRDLVSRIEIDKPERIIDLGCGPGNSTQVLAGRWPDAEITGLDSSPAMIEAATRDQPQRHWITGDIEDWASASGPAFDVVFSNAALQWVDDHPAVFPRLARRVAPGGVLAIQMPGNVDAPAHRLMRDLAASPSWRTRFTHPVREWHVYDLSGYYDLLAPFSRRVELWATEYIHLMPDSNALVEWYRGTGLRPFLEALPTDADRDRFAETYRQRLHDAYPRQSDGRLLFPFRRMFIVAYV
jgi:trans-aconitate 2-methyltransferase